MDYLKENAALVFERVARAHVLAAEMMNWHQRQVPGARPKPTPPAKTALYKMANGESEPYPDKLRYLCFWLLHGQARRPYTQAAWGNAGILAADMRRLPPDEFWRWHGAIAQGTDTVALLPRKPVAEPHKLHLVGIGALNVDSIVRAAAKSGQAAEGFDSGIEHVVTRDRYEEELADAAGLEISESLGGSAFNVVQALSFTAPDLKLGYVGCLGTDRSEKFFKRLDDRKVDRKFVFETPDARTSVSLSRLDGEERTLFTTEGDANDLLPKHMEDNYALIEYLARASVIHVSSIFDTDMPRVLLDLILAVKARSPVAISFDPGWVWCDRMDDDPALQGLLKQTDVLFLNPKEFARLAGSSDLTDEEGARRILPRCSEAASLLIYKQRTRTSLFSWDAGGRFEPRYLDHDPLTAEEIVDSTGAGDVMCAAMLLRLIYSNRISDKRLMKLARRLVLIKLQSNGTEDFCKFSGELREVLDGEED